MKKKITEKTYVWQFYTALIYTTWFIILKKKSANILNSCLSLVQVYISEGFYLILLNDILGSCNQSPWKKYEYSFSYGGHRKRKNSVLKKGTVEKQVL